MALAIDSSTPAVATLTGATPGTSLASAAFSPPANSLLVLLFSSQQSGPATTISAITDSLASHLTYTKLVAETANHVDAEVWIARVGGTAPGSMTVTATFGSAFDALLGVAVVTGAAATQNGATTGTTSGGGAPSATIASLVGANSLILGVVGNFTGSTLPTIPAGQSDSFNGHAFTLSSAGDAAAAWGQFLTGMNLAAGSSATINDTAPTVDYSMAIAEILAASSGSFTASTADTSTSTDAVSRVTALPRSTSDASASSDAVSRVAALPRSSADTSASSDATARTQALPRPVTDSTVSGDAVTRVARMPRSTTDASASSDVATGRRGTGRTLADSSSTGDAVTRSAQAFARSSADVSASSDSATRRVSLARSSTDASLSANATSRRVALVRFTADTSLSSDVVSHGAVPQPPCITPPTTAVIHPYTSTAVIHPYTSAVAVAAYTSTANIRAYSSFAVVPDYATDAGLVAYTSAAAIVTYTSGARIGPKFCP